MKLPVMVLFGAGCLALAAPLRAEEAQRAEPARNEPTRSQEIAASPFHAGASFDLLLAGRLAKLPLTLYGVSIDGGYRLHAGAGPVFTPLITLRAMRGGTPAGLLYTSHAVLGGIDLALTREGIFHLAFELGTSNNTLHGATSRGHYEADEVTGQVTMSLDFRVHPWLALRTGGGYRFLGGGGGLVLFVGGRL